MNIGNVYCLKNNYEKALEYYKQALKINEEIGERSGISSSMINIGILYSKQNKFENAMDYINRGLAIATGIKNKQLIKSCYEELSSIYVKTDNYKQAYKYYELYSSIKDTLYSQENSKNMAEFETKYQTTKKEKEIKILTQGKLLQEADISRQKILRNSFIVGFILILMLALFIFRSYRQKQSANRELDLKNKKIENAYNIIEAKSNELEISHTEIAEKNKDITNSISYAKRIQRAMLPHRSHLLSVFPQSFVLFKPKDIVSGDFYWFTEIDKSQFPATSNLKENTVVMFIAAADCTGHGVPGAFMSLLGTEHLNNAIKESLEPGEVLQHLNRGIKKSLQQSGDEKSTRDGMDIALVKCTIEHDAHYLQSKCIVDYAGANRPFWIMRNSNGASAPSIEEIKATKVAIGGLTPLQQEYATHRVELNKGDGFYLSSDGFADQFSQNDKKLMTKKFKELLLSIQEKSLEEQKSYLDSFIENWRGTMEQTDDILVIGIRV